MSAATHVLRAAAITLLAVHTADAQPVTGRNAPTNDERLLARADSITVGDYCRSAERVVGAPAVRAALGTSLGAAELSERTICEPQLASISLRTLHGDRFATFGEIARLRPQAGKATGERVFDAMSEFRRLVRNDSLRPIVREALDDSANRAFFTASETAELLFVRDARDAALARLARYERKLGPGSARLNAIEVLLNYGAQRFVPGFAATPIKGPSPLEVVSAYVPSYATIASGRAEAASAAEFGIRHYLFGDEFGGSGWRGIVRPAYWSAGALVVSDRSGALVWPWNARQHTGAFVSWGVMKVGYIPGRNGTLLVSRQLQFIPLVF
jgi:hypothetical protein